MKESGRYANARPFNERTLAIREKALGPEHPDVANSLNRLAILYYVQGQYGKAELLFERAHSLAALYHNQGRHGKAEPLYQLSLTIRDRALGPQHPDVAASLNSLAALHHNQGQDEKAEPLYRR